MEAVLLPPRRVRVPVKPKVLPAGPARRQRMTMQAPEQDPSSPAAGREPGTVPAPPRRGRVKPKAGPGRRQRMTMQAPEQDPPSPAAGREPGTVPAPPRRGRVKPPGPAWRRRMTMPAQLPRSPAVERKQRAAKLQQARKEAPPRRARVKPEGLLAATPEPMRRQAEIPAAEREPRIVDPAQPSAVRVSAQPPRWRAQWTWRSRQEARPAPGSAVRQPLPAAARLVAPPAGAMPPPRRTPAPAQVVPASPVAPRTDPRTARS